MPKGHRKSRGISLTISSRSLPKVRFLYRRSSRYLGSTLMRCFQMCALAQRHLGDRYDFGVIGLPRLSWPGVEAAWIALQPRGTTYILVKDVVDRFSPEGLKWLQSKAAGVGLDYIDRHLHIMPPEGIDIHISASYSGVEAMGTQMAAAGISGQTGLLLHGPDHRILGCPKAQMDHFQPVYFGSAHVTQMDDRVASQVPCIDVTNTDLMAQNIDQVVGANLHYAVRKIVTYPHVRGRKPFTKGATAAVLGANVLTHADEDDALHFLGPDYPYLCASTDPDLIYETLTKARKTFGQAEWHHAQRIMQTVEQRTAPAAQAEQLLTLIRQLRQTIR
jgi:hypothetical protein